MVLFGEFLNRSFIVELLCLIFQLIMAITLITYIYISRNKSPIHENSPKLTITAQIALFLASVSLLLGKLVIDPQSFLPCFGFEFDMRMILLGLFYVWCIQFMYMSYLLKMIRVLLICSSHGQRENVKKVFNEQWKLIALSSCWGVFIVMIQIGLSLASEDWQRLSMYPQFNQFFCDSLNLPLSESLKIVSTIIFTCKLLFCLGMFLTTWIYSYKLKKIDKSLRLRKQYFALLLLPYSVMVTDKILKLSNGNNFNTAFSVHYVDCLSNLITSFLLMTIHLSIELKKHLFLPQKSDLNDVDNGNIDYILKLPGLFDVLKMYFQQKNKINLLEKLKYLREINLNSINYNDEIESIKLILSQQNRATLRQNQTSTDMKDFDVAKGLLLQQFILNFDVWKTTRSGQLFRKRYEINTIYTKRMEDLGLDRSYYVNSHKKLRNFSDYQPMP